MPVVEQPPSAIGVASLSHTNARSPAKKPSVGIMAFPPPPLIVADCFQNARVGVLLLLK